MTNKLSELRERVIEANPEIMDKVCPDCGRKDVLRKVQGGWRCINCKSEYGNAKHSPHDKILGRSIRLADVLLAIDKAWPMGHNGTDYYLDVIVKWNLFDDRMYLVSLGIIMQVNV